MWKEMLRALSCLTITTLIFQAGGYSAQSPPPTPAQSQSKDSAPEAAEKDFVIGLEDVLSVNVWKETELSLPNVVVRPDGKITVPLVGDIQASGLTTTQLQQHIAEKLQDFVASPMVSVTVVKIASRSVSIVGQVSKPGVYTMGSPMTVMELLARAGGLGLDAKGKKIKIIRKEEGKYIQFPFNYNDVVKGKNLKQNIVLKTGDLVVVP